MVSRAQRYGKLVRGWDWRTTPERLEKAQRVADWLGVNRTTFIEMAIDKELKVVYLTEDNAGGLMVGNPIVGWWDVTEVQAESSFVDDAAAITSGDTKEWTVENYDENNNEVIATYSDGNISVQAHCGRAAQTHLRLNVE